MKKLAALAALAAALLTLAATAQADRGGVPHHKTAPTAPTSTFVCDGTHCTFTVNAGLAPLTAYDTSIAFVAASGSGCNTGTGGWRSDDSGVLVQILDEAAIKCGGTAAGSVTAWARNAGTAFNDPGIPGTSVTTQIG